ncbi:cation:proton antiporter [Legionella jordanis]|uniref:Na(+)/H(+) antiporter n=1 Tax=Legionella jordanis TaxID=456 RepID=A0A0W0VFK7_9GAMM|nr:cation:proton antiporter [Legionella jordanis]KTD18924.1 Na(+)/H(+) antiporter [Legionella jordanis]RMX05512.1 cation:proton antiporter [Legionella jordanis]RMX19197.1 cation:proton antiporter [Legionella jordanis]VEH13024.1 Na(+)/H(+) antiporter [Legionella jordanis]HAT8714067.1 cation:proton antiporter [Legionella jordanis]
MNAKGKYLILFALLCPVLLYAGVPGDNSHDPLAPILLWVTLILFAALVGRYLAQRFHQPAVLGELLMGVLLGNIFYYWGLPLATVLREGPAIFEIVRDMLAEVPLAQAVKNHISNPYSTQQLIAVLGGPHGLDLVKIGNILEVFSRYGVIFMLFMVGLESSMTELKHTGRESLQVAILGVITPILLGFVVAHLLMPESTYKVDLFVAATLAATSVGITARVLTEMKKLKTREARTILGAAMIDDILGLILLSIVSSLVTNETVDLTVILRIIISALLFFVAVLAIGPSILRMVVRFFNYFLEPWEVKLFSVFMFVMFLAWLATLVDLAAIIGAFCAGLILHDDFFLNKDQVVEEPSIKSLVAPLESILAPLFFILIGVQVKLESFLSWNVIILATGLIAAAIIGKLVSGLGGGKRDDRLLIGIGMMPRGEVGLVFASIGRSLNVISDDLFSAIILMVIVTTLLAPPLLKQRFKKKRKLKHAAHPK